ncbi:MAG: hypothetical protein IKA23_06520 [Akkermansia sp.]|nr:hypothetical protein [Akkermansia sp.]
MKKLIAQLAVVACVGFAVLHNQSEAASLHISIGSSHHSHCSVPVHHPAKHHVRPHKKSHCHHHDRKAPRRVAHVRKERRCHGH